MAKRGISMTGSSAVILVLALAVVSVAYFDTNQGANQQLSKLQTQVDQLSNNLNAYNASAIALARNLPVMNQTPTIRAIRETWYLSPEAHQDRFEPSFVVVNQGDTVHFTLIDNDTVAHDLVIGPPYNIVINATVPGLVNDLTHRTFAKAATNNSPGVVVRGTPGNVSADYTFVAKYPGVFEFVCTYHAQLGMIGYLVVLPNSGYSHNATAGHPSTNPGGLQLSIAAGAGANTTNKGYSPNVITLKIGVNDTVTWTNNDSAPHTVNADDGSFVSGNIAPGGFFSYTFTRPGTYLYHCVYHPWMTGTIVVKA